MTLKDLSTAAHIGGLTVVICSASYCWDSTGGGSCCWSST